MSIWPILIIGAVSTFFAWRHDNVRRLLNPAGRKSAQTTNKDELRRSLDALTEFLSKRDQFKWAGVLRSIRNELQNTATEPKALSRLGDLFGGMGSLNDLAFREPKADQESARLLDAVFRDMKLYNGTAEDRAEWRQLEEEHKNEPPPRIKHAFRKE